MQPLACAIAREFDAAIDALCSAWTDTDAQQQRYAPIDLTVAPASVDSELFGGSRWADERDASPDVFIAHFRGRYAEVIMPLRLAQYGELPEEEVKMGQTGVERYFDSLAA
jgi:hypothetical protein